MKIRLSEFNKRLVRTLAGSAGHALHNSRHEAYGISEAVWRERYVAFSQAARMAAHHLNGLKGGSK